MSITQSNLSSPNYNYPVVAAATQQSINSTMKTYLSTLSQPLARVCFIADASGNPELISYENLLMLARQSDPFTVPPDANPNTNQDLLNLKAARFMAGFKARIGIPAGLKPVEIPDIVTLRHKQLEVTFRLMCAEFTIVNLRPGGGYDPATWTSLSQPLGAPWLFESNVEIAEIEVGSDHYNTLPPDVQKAISKLPAGTFGVQQLLFDLDNAILRSVPDIKGVDRGSLLDTLLRQYFLGAYFSEMQELGQPILGCTITRTGDDHSTLDVTNVQLQLGPHVDAYGSITPMPTPEQQARSTLNYVCSIGDQGRLPLDYHLRWNWIEPGDGVDGVVAINRSVFTQYIFQQLLPIARRSCFKPYVRVWYEFPATVWYQWSNQPYQMPVCTFPESGPSVLKMSWRESASDQAGLDGALGRMVLESIYDCDVQFVGNTIVVTQNLKIYVYVRFLATPGEGYVVDKTVVNTFYLGVDSQGNLTSTVTSTVTDTGKVPDVNGFLAFWADVKPLAEAVKRWASALANVSLKDLPLSVVRSFIFPGGNTFVFKDVLFSNYQDLVSQVVYADPSVHLSKLGRSKALARGTKISASGKSFETIEA
jgi:hypothetical protein